MFFMFFIDELQLEEVTSKSKISKTNKSEKIKLNYPSSSLFQSSVFGIKLKFPVKKDTKAHNTVSTYKKQENKK